ncbi:MAG: type II toxin-antitoxin system HicA family toxin [Acidobacteria bacterium]|nr:type II toxin-antitoxin system HicA family toxin [Acidobacteriota bacterium]
MDSAAVIKRLERDGWELKRVSGSHHLFRRPGRPGRVIVPHPRKDVPVGTLRNIWRQAGWQWTGRP